MWYIFLIITFLFNFGLHNIIPKFEKNYVKLSVNFYYLVGKKLFSYDCQNKYATRKCKCPNPIIVLTYNIIVSTK